MFGDPVRLINGYDSFGNTCGVSSNERFKNFNLSGLNTIDKPNLFFLNVKELRQTLKVCVKSCPNEVIMNKEQLYKYYTTSNNQLCRYDFNMSLLNQPIPKGINYFDILGPCPSLPIYERYDMRDSSG